MKLHTPIHPDFFIKALETAVEEQAQNEKTPNTAYDLESAGEGGISILLWQGVTKEGNLYFDANYSARGEGTLVEGEIVKHTADTDGATRMARYFARATMALVPGILSYLLALAILFAFSAQSFVLPLVAPIAVWVALAVRTALRRARTEKRLLTFFTKTLGATIQA